LAVKLYSYFDKSGKVIYEHPALNPVLPHI
jgi:hypothetical protein